FAELVIGRRFAPTRWLAMTATLTSRCRPSMLPCPHIAEQESGDLAFLDFLAAFGDAVAAVMAVDVFERLVARITHAAMHLHGAVRRLAAQPVRPEIAHRDFVRERVLDLRLGQLIHL